ncbi:MAG: Ig-like domain-containing protein [Oscillospiraceae bacterium]|nr:Ig-like domain-containing protein [Oscillospiraceae bacterium]
MLRSWKKGLLCLLAMLCLLSFSVQAKDLNADCPEYSFVSIDGKNITNSSNAGKVTLIIYAHMSSSHDDIGTLIRNLVSAEWIGHPGLSVAVVDFMGNTVDAIRQFVQPYADSNTDIAFCADAGDSFFSFLNAAGLADSPFSLPLSFLVDAGGTLRDCLKGETTEIAFRTLLSGYVEDIDPAPTATLSVTGKNVYSEAFKIVDLINTQRRQNGLSAVKMDKGLLDAAMLRAAECAIYYSHTRPNGTQCFTVLPSGGGSSGENIAVGQQDAEQVMESWMNSPGHRANILNGNFASVGVGAFLHNGVYTWVQLFSSNPAASVKKPDDATKSAKLEVLQEHLVPRAEPAQLMLKENTEKTVSLYFVNRGFDPQRTQPDSAALTFRSSDPKVAKVDSKGVVTGISPGSAEITITLTGADKKATVSVLVTEHDYQTWKYSEPTCGAPGFGTYKCGDCGERIELDIPQLTAHFWDSGVVTEKPTTKKEGTKTYTCTYCGDIKTEHIPMYSALKPMPTVPPTAAPTVPATSKPTASPTVAPTVPPTVAATSKPTVPPTAAPTVLPTVEPTAVPTEKTTAPAIQAPTETVATTEPADILSEPTQPPTTIVTESADPVETAPASAPTETPTQPTTQLPTAPENPPAEDADTKLIIGIIVAVVATLAAGAFLIFWKRKK